MKPHDFARSPADQATITSWRRGVLMLYGSVGLVLVAVIAGAHFAHVAMQIASR
jgi:hypothetical protein